VEALKRSTTVLKYIGHCNTESLNVSSTWYFILQGVALAQRRNDGSLVKNHIITSSVEHPAVAETLKYLVDRFGFRLTTVPVDAYGIIDRDEFQKSICDDTFLISVMHANNEVGSINPIAELVKLAKDRNPNVVFHTGAQYYSQYFRSRL
jgi:cysteine desulfurase